MADSDPSAVRRPGIAEALAEAAREINSPRDLNATLDAIVHSARRSLPGIDEVGISIAHRDGTIETRAATGDLVWELDKVQYALNEGPCVYAIENEKVVVVNDIRHDQRWPRYVPKALELGIASQMGVRLYVEDKTLGGLNMYSTSTETLDEEVEQIAELFAVHAALALGRARHEENLNAAMSTRRVIGQAVGMVMERYALDEESAFGYLTRVSQQANVKLRDVAQELVDQAEARATKPGP